MRKYNSRSRYVYLQTVLVFLICAEIAWGQSQGVKRSQTDTNLKHLRSITKQIDSLVKNCDTNIDKYKNTSKTVFEDGSETMLIEGYFDALGLPIKLVTTNVGAENQRTEVIYYNNEKMIFSLQTDCYFPNGIHEKDDFITLEEHRLYFSGGKLIKWIERVETDVSSDEDDYPSRESEALRNSIEYINLLTSREN